MENVAVDLNKPSLYCEPEMKSYRFKRKLMMQAVLRRIRKIVPKNKTTSLREIVTGSVFLISLLESAYPKASFSGI